MYHLFPMESILEDAMIETSIGLGDRKIPMETMDRFSVMAVFVYVYIFCLSLNSNDLKEIHDS